MAQSTHSWTGLAAALIDHPRYWPVKRLGKQSGRQTLLCQDRKTGQKVVAKLLSFSEDFAWDSLKLFEREAEVLRSLDHPAIPRYLDYFELETPTVKGFVLVQSCIEARSLQQYLEAGRSFDEDEIRQISQQLLEILQYLHSRQPAVVHRDIKPSNILLTDRTSHSPGKVYLVDFGSVQTLAAREGGTVTVVGTYGYMPPEQFGGRAVPVSDLYSLGAVLLELTTGENSAERLSEGYLNLASEGGSVFTSWLYWLLQDQPKRRPASTQQAIAALQAMPEASTDRAHWVWQSETQQWSAQAIAQLLQKPKDSSITIKSDGNRVSVVYRPKIRVSDRGAQLYHVGCLFPMALFVGLSFIGGSAEGILNALKQIEENIWPGLILCALLFPIFILLILFGIWMLKKAVSWLRELIVWPFWQQTQIDFSHEISVWKRSYCIGKLRWQRLSRRSRLDKIMLMPARVVYSQETGPKLIKTCLKLHIGTEMQDFDLTGPLIEGLPGVSSSVSDIEMRWLAQEMSQGLNIPLEILDRHQEKGC